MATLTKKIVIGIPVVFLVPTIIALVLVGIEKWDDLSVKKVLPTESRILEPGSDLPEATWYKYDDRDDEVVISIDDYSFLKSYGFKGSFNRGVPNTLAVKRSSKSGLMMIARSSLVNVASFNAKLSHGGLVVFSKDQSFIKVLPFPHKVPGGPGVYTWLGDGNIFLSYGVKEDEDYLSYYYYYVNPFSDAIDYRPIKVHGNLALKNAVTFSSPTGTDGKFLPNRNNSLFAASYCLKHEGVLNSTCTRIGVSVSRGVNLEEVMVKNMDSGNYITIGWKGDKLYIVERRERSGEEDILYTVNTETLSL